MEGRTAVRPSGITPDFHAAFKQTWYKVQAGRPRLGLKSLRRAGVGGFSSLVVVGHAAPNQRARG